MNNKKIAIIGGGITGLLSALALGRLGFFITLIEKKSFSWTNDNRSFAISANSKDVLADYGLWDSIAEYASPINQIRITHSNSPQFLHFNEENANNQPMGFMLSAKVLIDTIYKKLLTIPNVQLLSELTYQNVYFHNEKSFIEFNDNKSIEAELLIIAEGKSSHLRDLLNIKTTKFDYHQTSFVFNISHQFHHNFVAIENFYAQGPFASLPLQGGYHSAIVWTVPKKLKKLLMKISEKEFLEYIAPKLQDYLGEIKLSTPIHAFDLTAVWANNYFYKQAVLVGDSAHTIHPIAGQGLNLTIRDIDYITRLIQTQYSLGLDIGSSLLLNKYNKYRQQDNNSMIAATHLCNSIFSSNSSIISFILKCGLSTIDKLPNLKNLLVRYAMGYREGS